MTEFQVTLFCESGKYKPISCIVREDEKLSKILGASEFTKRVKLRGIEKMCIQKYWTSKELVKYGYTKCKVRIYDKEKIAKEKAERYEKIKEEKYASGEWKRPKKEKIAIDK